MNKQKTSQKMTKQMPVSSTEKVLWFLKENKKSKYTAVDIKKTVFKNKKTKKQVDKTMWNLTKRKYSLQHYLALQLISYYFLRD